MEIECNHQDSGRGICLHCQIEMPTNLQPTIKYAKNNKSLWKDGLDRLTFLPEHIRHRADEIYQAMPISSCRKGRREIVMLYCLIEAINQAQYSMTPNELVAKMGLKQSIISSIQRICVEQIISKKETSMIKIKNPQELLPAMAKKLHLDEDYIFQTLQKFFNETLAIIEETDCLANTPPQLITAGILYYYMVLRNGRDVKIGDISRELDVAVSSLQTVYREICKVL
jgi:transcription initiation factor TFIIIB Brf1 subunit/transcription initiation factor TFIIB